MNLPPHSVLRATQRLETQTQTEAHRIHVWTGVITQCDKSFVCMQGQINWQHINNLFERSNKSYNSLYYVYAVYTALRIAFVYISRHTVLDTHFKFHIQDIFDIYFLVVRDISVHVLQNNVIKHQTCVERSSLTSTVFLNKEKNIIVAIINMKWNVHKN